MQTAEAAPCTCVGSDPRTQSERSYALQGRFQALDGSQLKEPTNGIIMLRRLSRVITPDRVQQEETQRQCHLSGAALGRDSHAQENGAQAVTQVTSVRQALAGPARPHNCVPPGPQG